MFIITCHDILQQKCTIVILNYFVLLGKTQKELPDVRQHILHSEYVDQYPLIWFDYENQGYVTLFSEDNSSLAVFNRGMTGFDDPPTDHYMRPFWQAVTKSRLNTKSKPFCLGAKPKHRFTLEYVKDFFDKYQNVPKFAFSFFSELGHSDANSLEYLDEEFKRFLLKMRLNGYLENTVLLVAGLHGTKISKVGVTEKLEWRQPSMSIVPPRRWQEHHRNLIKILFENSERLTTPFDVHETLLDLLNVTRTIENISKPVKADSRHISWFRRIPFDRTCKSATIATHWCPCLTFLKLNTSSQYVQQAANALLQFVNNETAAVRHRCVELTDYSILEAAAVIHKENVCARVFN